MPDTNGKWRSGPERKRIAWLKAHPRLAEVPTDREDVGEAQSALLGEMYTEALTVGLYSKSTKAADVRWGIRIVAGLIKRGVVA